MIKLSQSACEILDSYCRKDIRHPRQASLENKLLLSFLEFQSMPGQSRFIFLQKKKTIPSVEKSLYPHLLVVSNFATSSHFTRTAVLILFVITVHLFANFTDWFWEALTHWKAWAGRTEPIAETKHGTVLLWNKFTDRVWLSFVVTALKEKKSL